MPHDADHLPQQEELLAAHLRSFLGLVDEATLEAVRHKLRWLQLAGGETLMRQGEQGDALYMLVSGRLRVYVENEQGTRVIREIARGEIVGEMSLYTDQPRSATLVAIRDSVLVSLDRPAFDWLLVHAPQVSTALARQIIGRLQSERGPTVIDKPVTMTVLPVTEGVDAGEFARDLAGHVARHGRVHILDAARMNAQLAPHGHALDTLDRSATRRAVALLLDRIETEHDYVLLVADAEPTPWTDVCTRHADEILLLADARAAPRVHRSEQQFLVDRPPQAEATEILVLLHPADTRVPRATGAWLARRPVDDHVHLRRGEARDMARLARLQTRNAVGLVLAGGGARGFAHLGVFRALAEHGVEIDCVGGTSIGAVMAALVATGLPWQEATALARRSFERSPTDDYTLLPLISLLKGRKLRRVVQAALDEAMGEGAGIEDLWKGYFCMATNYSHAREQVLRRGPLLRALLASIAIPGVLPPVVWEGDLLCDGGTFDNFPVDVMRRWRGVRTVIGVDLNRSQPRKLAFDEVPSGLALLLDRLRPRARRRWRLPSLPSLLINTTILYSVSRQKTARLQTDLYLNPPLDRVGMLDWRKFDQVVAQGHAYAREVLAADPAFARPAPAASAGERVAPEPLDETLRPAL